MNIKEKIYQIRQLMKIKNIQIYYIPISDYHQSEYIGEYFKCLEYMSGFNGSAGNLVITEEKVGLWTDGRYFIQAEIQLKNTGIVLQKSNEPNVLTVLDFIKEEMKEGETIGFNGKIVTTDFAEQLKLGIKEKKGIINSDSDLVGEIWKDRPQLSDEPIFILEEKYTGESYISKLKKIREKIIENKGEIHILNTLDDIAWIYNVRGNDVKNTPVTLAFAIITLEESILYISSSKLTKELKKYFAENNIVLKDYEEIYSDVNLYDNQKILLDKSKINFSLYNNIKNSNEIISRRNPSMDMKAIKNQIEIKNTKEAHIEDAIAMVKFIFWLKNINLEKDNITEYDIAKKLESYRKLSKNYIEPSFDTIAAFGKNAAMMHYKPTLEKSNKLKYGSLFLLDSGGQYFTGTTDITRTFALENSEIKVSNDLKNHFTLVLKGMINLSKAKFLSGVTGTNLDILAREPIWNIGIDYKCGTGHGIGFVLGVHEGPHSIRPSYTNEPLNSGMIVTNEPGIYIENSHGIRIENELLIKEFKETEFGKFLEFEPLTFVPIDLEAINKELLNLDEIKYLNDYHEKVYNKLNQYLSDEEKEWLKINTRKI